MIHLVLLEQGEYDGNGGGVLGGDGVSFGRSCWGCCNRRDRREGRINTLYANTTIGWWMCKFFRMYLVYIVHQIWSLILIRVLGF